MGIFAFNPLTYQLKIYLFQGGLLTTQQGTLTTYFEQLVKYGLDITHYSVNSIVLT